MDLLSQLATLIVLNSNPSTIIGVNLFGNMYLTHFLSISLAFLLTIYPTPSSQHTSPQISHSTRAHWVRHANAALPSLSSPCPFMAFSTAIVNHSDTSVSPHGQLICLGVNDVLDSGNPTLHGEVAAINNCTEILKQREGWRGEDVGKAWRELSLYTNGEPCPMVCLPSSYVHVNILFLTIRHE